MPKARSASKIEVSAGGVVYRKTDDGVQILLIRPSRDSDGDRWMFPKGWTGDHGAESIEATALREVREEGGVRAKIIEPLGKTEYFFMWAGERIQKAVHYFLMEYISGDPEEHDEEVAEARWIPLEEVRTLLSYEKDQEIFAKAVEKLSV